MARPIDLERRISTATCLLPLLSIVFSGCGSGDPFEYVQVSGRVSYEDGTLIPTEKLRVTFIPQMQAIDGRTHPRAGTAYANVADGSFENFTSHLPGDGVVPGKHRVLIVALDKNEAISPLVPRKYSSGSQTPLIVDAAETPFHFQIPKP